MLQSIARHDRAVAVDGTAPPTRRTNFGRDLARLSSAQGGWVADGDPDRTLLQSR